MQKEILFADNNVGISDLWRKAIQEGETVAHIQLGKLLEEHLAMTLQSHIQNTSVGNIVAITYLSIPKNAYSESLIELAGRCLVIAGFFPELAKKRNIRVSYYLGLGKGAYHSHASYWSGRGNKAYARLSAEASEKFHLLVGTLRGMKDSPSVREEIEAYAIKESAWN